MIKERDHTNAISFVLLGLVLGAVSHAVLTTHRGQQLRHDAALLFDDFVDLCDVLLDDATPYENTLDSVSAFVHSSLKSLDKMGGIPVQVSQPLTEVRVERPVIVEVPIQKSVSPTVQPEMVAPRVVDDDVALLKRISRGLR